MTLIGKKVKQSSKRRAESYHSVHFLQDNEQPHVAVHTMTTITNKLYLSTHRILKIYVLAQQPTKGDLLCIINYSLN